MVVKKIFRNYAEDNSGQVAVITAVVALPLLLGVSLALDTNRSERSRAKLQSALDNAAIAAVTDQTLVEDERAKYAEERFWANVSNDDSVDFEVISSEGNQIELAATVEVPTLFAGIIGRDTLAIKETSAAEIVKGTTVCMLALDPDSARSFEVTHGASIDANCSIQVNSLHEKASIVDHGGKAAAQSFCVGGGALGDHYPFVNTECATLDDPYEDIDIPYPSEPCVDQNELNTLMNDWRSGRDSVEEHEAQEDQRWADATAAGRVWYPTYFEKNRLKPGNYCQGLYMEGKEFILEPGEYHITGGSLLFGLGTELIGEGVIFILHNNAQIDILDGSILDIKGPDSGPYDGLVIAQSMENKSIYDPSFPNVTSTITGGAKLDLLGTVYLPSHKIQFLGGSLSKTYAPATSFIAHQISISDGAVIGVSADHVAAGITPIQPRSDDGARLVR